MRLEDLKFKVITGTMGRNSAIQKALFEKGGSWCDGSTLKAHLGSDFLGFNTINSQGHFKKGLIYGYLVERFNGCLSNEVTFRQALDLIAQVEVPEPEFDIKLRDEVLARDDNDCVWGLADFAYILNHANYFACKGCSSYRKIIKATDESIKLLGTAHTPDGWWECKNGNHIWIKRG